jgi:hypothetical protein
MKAYGGVDVYTFFLTSALVGGERSALRPGQFTSGTHWIGGWVDPRAGLDDVEKRKFLILPGLELRPLGRSARTQSLYRLRYPGLWMEEYAKQVAGSRQRNRTTRSHRPEVSTLQRSVLHCSVL